MNTTEPVSILIGGADGRHVSLKAKMANRHGMIAGATGIGKTITMQVRAEGFSRAGVPVFLAAVKGDVSGLGQLGMKVQHALRAFTPKEKKAVSTVAQNFRANPELDSVAAISDLGVAEGGRLLRGVPGSLPGCR